MEVLYVLHLNLLHQACGLALSEFEKEVKRQFHTFTDQGIYADIRLLIAPLMRSTWIDRYGIKINYESQMPQWI